MKIQESKVIAIGLKIGLGHADDPTAIHAGDYYAAGRAASEWYIYYYLTRISDARRIL